MTSKNKKQNEVDAAKTTQGTGPSQQSVIAGLEAQLAAAKAEAAPIEAEVRQYEDAVRTLTHELTDRVHAQAADGVMRLVPKYEMTPEERMAKEKELAEKSELLKGWEKKLGSPVTYDSLEAMNQGRTTAKIEKLQEQIKGVAQRAEDHRRNIAALESSDNVGRVQAKAEEKRRESKKLAEEAARLEIERQSEIAKERAELRRLTGSS